LGIVKAEIYAKDIDKTIVRMVQGRKEREAKNRMLARDSYQHDQKPAKKTKLNNTPLDCNREESSFKQENRNTAKLMKADPQNSQLISYHETHQCNY
jgi:hypothetical protein